MNKGFTLIELLVVVLIIGILAAIALPQYTKAVERSRMSEAVQLLGDLATAQSVYYMQNNAFASTIGDLNNGDIQVPTTTTNWGNPSVSVASNSVAMTLTRGGGMYGNSSLTITVKDDGSISKSCTKNVDGFGTIANAAGYGSCTSATTTSTSQSTEPNP